MSEHFRTSVTFLDARFHGRGDGGVPEWPPSPLRLLQAIVAANADQLDETGPLERALVWLEEQPPPVIVAPRGEEGSPYSLSVPNNAMDLVAKAWTKGNYFGGGDSNPAKHRTMKVVRPVHLVDGNTVHYLWPLRDALETDLVEILIAAVRRMVSLGWGTDLVVVEGARIDAVAAQALPGQRWSPTDWGAVSTLRVPIGGTLQGLRDRHEVFTGRMGTDGFVPVAPLTAFETVGYRRPNDPVGRPFVAFELRHDDGAFCQYSQRKLIHLAGMTRHLAQEAMRQSPPSGVDDRWVDRYVAGHRSDTSDEHRQLSYLPLPSIGHEHADQVVRRMLIAAPLGDVSWLEHLARRLEGRQLVAERGDEFGTHGPPTLIRIRNDNVVRSYRGPASSWASITPVILPGHDDRKPEKTRKLIEGALAQSGIEQACEFEWSPYSRFRKSFSAHKYGKNKRPQGYFRPDHLLTQTAVHLTLSFEYEVAGPLVLGAGRHCGLGLMAPVLSQS